MVGLADGDRTALLVGGEHGGGGGGAGELGFGAGGSVEEGRRNDF